MSLLLTYGSLAAGVAIIFWKHDCVVDPVPLYQYTPVLISLTLEGWQAESTPWCIYSAADGAWTQDPWIPSRHPNHWANTRLLFCVVVVVWQLSCRGSYHFLKRDCVADVVHLYQYTHWNWYSFRRPRKDDRLSQPPGVLIQRPTGLELRTLGSQATTLTTEPTPGY